MRDLLSILWAWCMHFLAPLQTNEPTTVKKTVKPTIVRQNSGLKRAMKNAGRGYASTKGFNHLNTSS